MGCICSREANKRPEDRNEAKQQRHASKGSASNATTSSDASRCHHGGGHGGEGLGIGIGYGVDGACGNCGCGGGGCGG